MQTEVLLSNLSFKFSKRFASLQELLSECTHPKAFPILQQNVSNPQLMFALCLALKQKIKETNTKTTLLSTTDIAKQKQDVFAGHRSFIQSNALWLQIQKTMQSRVNQKKNNSFQLGLTSFNVNEEYFGKQQEVNLWCMQMNYLSLLIESIKMMKHLQNFTPSELQMQQATSKLQDEVISKLIFECLITQQNLSKKFKIHLTDIFLQLQKAIPLEEKQAGYRLTNILSQMLNYVNKEALYTRWMRLSSKFGRQVTNLTINLFDVFGKAHYFDIINNILDVVNQLFNLDKLTNTPFEEKLDNLKVENKQLVQDDNQLLPPYIQNKCFKFVQMMEIAFVGVLQIENPLSWQSQSKINDIVANISYSCSSSCEDPFRKNYKAITQKNQVLIKAIFRLQSEILAKSYNKLSSLEDESQIDFYYEFSFVQKIMKSIYRNMNYILQNNDILQFLMLNYFPLLIRKIKISFENGGNHPINVMFFYFKKMVISFQHNQQLINQIRDIFNLFVVKCSTSKYNEDFDDFAQENAACYEYFKGMVSLFGELEKYFKRRSQLSNFTLIYELIDTILTSNNKAGHYLIRFVLQLLRTNQFMKDNSDEIMQMMVFLSQRLKQSAFKKQYLIILDIVSDQLIDSQAFEFDQNISYLWFYIRKNSDENLDQFINFLGAEIVNMLVTQQEIYFTSYCISIICRTCKKLGKVERNRVIFLEQQQNYRTNELKRKQKLMYHRESLIKTYLFAVYNFFTNMENSKLNELGYFDKRSQFLQIIGYLGVGTMEDAYLIFNESIIKNMVVYGQQTSLYFLTDTTGLILANSRQLFRISFIQLIMETLRLNPQILGRYSLQTLNNNELYFNVFYQFIKAINYCCQQIKFEHSTEIINFFRSIEPIINLLHKIYNTDNYQKITEIWLAYIKCGSPKNYLPLLPQKLYQTKLPSAQRLLKFYCSNLIRVQKIQQVLIVFRNVFERKKLNWCNYEQKMQSNIIIELQTPKMLILFADYVQISNLGCLFDYQSLTKDIVRNLYSTFITKKNISYSSVLNEMGGYDQDDDYGSDTNEVYKTYVDDFLMTKAYKQGVKELARAHHTLAYAAKGEEVDFHEFQTKFIEELREMLKLENL